jgi:hypothetical protein
VAGHARQDVAEEVVRERADAGSSTCLLGHRSILGS